MNTNNSRPPIGAPAPLRVLIGVPCGDTITVKTHKCLVELVLTCVFAGIEVDLFHAQGSDPSLNQNIIIATALRDGFDAVLFVDSDVTMPPDTIARLAAHNVPIVGCPYRSRFPGHVGWLEVGARRQIPEDFRGPALEPVDYLPTGLLFVRREVFLTIPYPWMSIDYGPSVPANPRDLSFRHIGQDVNFCAKALRAGYEIFADFALAWECRHQMLLPHGLEGGRWGIRPGIAYNPNRAGSPPDPLAGPPPTRPGPDGTARLDLDALAEALGASGLRAK